MIRAKYSDNEYVKVFILTLFIMSSYPLLAQEKGKVSLRAGSSLTFLKSDWDLLSNQKFFENQVNVLMSKKATNLKVWINSNLIDKYQEKKKLEDYTNEFCQNSKIEKKANEYFCLSKNQSGESFHRFSIVEYQKKKFVLHNELLTKGDVKNIEENRKQLDRLYEGI